MTVIRNTPAFIAVRRELIDCADISWGARGLMVWIDAQPDDWRFSFDDLARASGHAYSPFQDPLKVVEYYVDELLAIGYLEDDQ